MIVMQSFKFWMSDCNYVTPEGIFHPLTRKPGNPGNTCTVSLDGRFWVSDKARVPLDAKEWECSHLSVDLSAALHTSTQMPRTKPTLISRLGSKQTTGEQILSCSQCISMSYLFLGLKAKHHEWLLQSQGVKSDACREFTSITANKQLLYIVRFSY